MSSQWFLDQARLGNMYHSHNTTAGAVTVLSATCTGLVLSNPLGSNKELVVSNMSFVGSTLSTIAEMGIAVSSALAVAVQTGTGCGHFLSLFAVLFYEFSLMICFLIFQVWLPTSLKADQKLSLILV